MEAKSKGSRRKGPSPRGAQRNGQSAISQEDPLRELNQAGAAESVRPVFCATSARQLTDEEVSVLCDIETAGSTGSKDRRITMGLVERGFIDVISRGTSRQFKLTAKAQQLLAERGVGLNES